MRLARRLLLAALVFACLPASASAGGPAWAYARPGFPAAWATGTGSPAVVIALVDTGVDSAVLHAPVLAGWNAVDGDADDSDLNGHGTQTASLAAAACGGCSILPVRVGGADGVTPWSATAAGITWAVDHGARVVSISLGGPESSPDLEAAVAAAESRGALVVAAAGNQGRNGVDYPAALPGVISVEASDSADRVYPFSNHGRAVTLAAPGCAAVPMLAGAKKIVCGTSMATPLVAGAAGLLFSADPSATAAQVASALEHGADRVTDSRYGRLNVPAALAALTSPARRPRATAARPG
jgi:thermitase